jgi:ABC transport system ATP-binding/permease protein
MTLLINCQSLTKDMATKLLFKDLSLSIFEGDRIGLIGPNGSGKSTLLKILSGIEKPTSGTIAAKNGLKIGYVPQTCEFPAKTTTEILLEAIKTDQPDYEKELIVKTWLSKFGFTGNEPTANLLSGGWKKRLSLAVEIVQEPDLLLLDEPTNHLDLEGILWLEKFLTREAPTYLLVSHDRHFLQNMASRIIEIDKLYPNGLFAIDGTYSNFLEKKEEFIKGQLEQERSLSSKARREVDWLRQTAKARTSKSRARIEDAHELLEQLSDVKRRNQQKRTDLDFSASERETRKLVVAKNLAKSIGSRLLFHHLDFVLSPGTRMGLMGPNGSGKTTLLKLLAGEITTDQGTLKVADALKIVYFDQHRMQFPDNITLREALSPKGDFVTYQGQQIHVNGWCKRFLFTPDVLDMPIGKLSGGERARISIAHLMLQPADLLLLDEPTNDLDIPTLETLEETLLEFSGAVVLITHDRFMLERICNAVVALGDLDQNQIYADYNQWESSLKKRAPAEKPKEEKSPAPEKSKLNYNEKKEYAQIERKISNLEEEIKQLTHLIDSPEIAQDAEKLRTLCSQVGLAENQLEQLYLRWDELSKKHST